MRTCDVAVIGLGLMGSAALYALAGRGADVLGFDPLPLGSDRGSSHGSCRIFRRFNAENVAYTALSDQAFAGWRALEAASGAAALAAGGAPGGPRTGAEANTAFPAFNLPDDWDVVVQDSGGILLAEAAMRAFREDAGDRVVAHAARLQATPAGLRIT